MLFSAVLSFSAFPCDATIESFKTKTTMNAIPDEYVDHSHRAKQRRDSMLLRLQLQRFFKHHTKK